MPIPDGRPLTGPDIGAPVDTRYDAHVPLIASGRIPSLPAGHVTLPAGDTEDRDE